MQLEVSLDLINKVIIVQAVVLASIFIFTTIKKVYASIVNRVSERRESIWRKKLILFLVEKKKTSFPNSFEFHCFLADYALSFKGKYRLQLDELYIGKGFFDRDKELLGSFRSGRRLKALRRIDQMGMVLPLPFLENLTTHKDLFFSCAVLFSMIKTHNRKAAPFVFSFFHSNRGYSKGILVNLLKYYGKLDPIGLKFLLERVDDEYFQEALLTAIYYSPVENVDESILLMVKNSAPVENKIMALKILDQYKTESTLKLMKILASQKNWILKIYIAKMMHSYEFCEINGMLTHLLEEENFHVRTAACKALMNFRPRSNEVIESILICEAHPSREILHHHLSVEQIEVNYVA